MRHLLKAFSRFRLCVLIAWAICGMVARSEAQISFGATVSTTSVVINTPFTYTLHVTNDIISPLLVRVESTVTSGAWLNVLSVSNNYAGSTVTNDGPVLVITIPNLQFGLPARIDLTVATTNAVTVTNRFDVFLGDATNIFASRTLVTQTTNPPTIPSDLAVSIIGPGPEIYVDDWITFGVVVTNRATNTATGVVLSNRFSPVIRSVAPPNQFTNGVAVLNLGTIANRGSQRFNFTVQATNAADFVFTTTVNAGIQDTDPSNNTASTNFSVLPFLTNELVAAVISTQRFNGVMGVFDQQIAISNASPSSVPSARINVGNIPSASRLFNAIGTNNGLPFVVYPTNIAAGATVDLLLQFRIPSYQTFTNVLLTANAMTNAADLTPPPGLMPLSVAGATNYTRIAFWGDNGRLLEFPSTNGGTYTVVYSEDPSFSNPKVVRPSIVAPANWTYWLDYGPPATVSKPSESPTRFYIIYQNP